MFSKRRAKPTGLTTPTVLAEEQAVMSNLFNMRNQATGNAEDPRSPNADLALPKSTSFIAVTSSVRLADPEFMEDAVKDVELF